MNGSIPKKDHSSFSLTCLPFSSASKSTLDTYQFEEKRKKEKGGGYETDSRGTRRRGKISDHRVNKTTKKLPRTRACHRSATPKPSVPSRCGAILQTPPSTRSHHRSFSSSTTSLRGRRRGGGLMPPRFLLRLRTPDAGLLLLLPPPCRPVRARHR